MVDLSQGQKRSDGATGAAGGDGAGRSGGPGRAERAEEPRADLPFPAVVGQSDLKRALLSVAVADDLGGVLVRGEKGTAKSTAVRGLADLLPAQRAVADCPYGCHPEDAGEQCAECRDRENPPVEERPVPLVTLPLGATRDRVVGTLSVSDALDGEATFDPGLLARANRGILYVDEVNLLDDHLVDVLLDAAAGGVNRVERDGVSVSHPANLTLVGTMNPEEGDLRPQLRDRFALQATVTGCEELDDRVTVLERALDGDRAVRKFDDDVAELRKQVVAARERDPDLPEESAREIAELCCDAGVEGHRADIATARTALALAALEGRSKVIESDVREAAQFTLPHRLQSRPFEDPPDPEDVLDDHFDDEDDPGNADDGDGDDTEADDGAGETEGQGDGSDSDGGDGAADGGGDDVDGDPTDSGGSTADTENGADGSGEDDGEHGDGEEGPGPAPAGGDGERNADDGDSEDEERAGGDDDEGEQESDGDGNEREGGTPLLPGQSRATVGDAAAPAVEAPETDGDAPGRGGTRTAATPSVGNRGARVRTERATGDDSIDAAASVRAAASRGANSVERRDLRNAIRAGTEGALVVFVVDASASMRPALRAAKGVVLELLEESYRERDEVAFVTVAGERSEVVLPPTDSVALAARHLKDLPGGDRTPLPDGLDTAGEVIDAADPESAVVVLLTDGRANVADGSPSEQTRAAARRLAARDPGVVVVDAGEGGRAALTDTVVTATDADRVPLDALSAGRIERAVDDHR